MKVRIITLGTSLQKTEFPSAKKLTNCILCLIFLCVLTQIADCDRYVGVLDCSKTFRDYFCHMPDVCRGFCKSSCQTEPRQVYGSGIFEQDSSICRSALHDRRISAWDPSKRDVSFQEIQSYRNPVGSIMFGVQSQDIRQKTNYGYTGRWNYREYGFVFTNPRIKEEILDVFSVHQKYLFKEGEKHVQQCFDAGTAPFHAFTFNKFVPDERKNFQGTSYSVGGKVMYTMKWAENSGKAQIGGFQCLPNNSTLSIITSLAMKADADFFPEWFTYTVIVNRPVTLSMESHTENYPCDIVWKKDNKVLPTNGPKASGAKLTFSSVMEGNQGIYSVSCESQPEKRGIMRLIVRVCPENKYGDGCKRPCPKCENGGVCHDITGVCICAPGFSGDLCEEACPHGYIGQRSCRVSCPKDGGDQSDQCKGLLICLPDPYGCSCGSGYKGIFCNESCAPGEYGAGCSQKRNCHCYGEQSCDKYSGTCPSGCSPGWHGDSCTISYPVLSRTKVYLLSSTKNTLSLSFGNWNPSTDIGEGNPVGYTILIEELNSNGNSWNKEIRHDGQEEMNAITLDNLKPKTDYLIRVAVVDRSEHSQQNDLKKYIFSTSCDPSQETQEYCSKGVCYTPTGKLPPPTNVTLETTERDVNVKWELPPPYLWKCRSVGIVVKYKSSRFQKEQEVHEDHYSFSSKPYTQWEVIVCLRSQIKDSNEISCSKTVKGSTKEDAPGRVQNLHCPTKQSTGFSIEWERPSEKNGQIRYYALKYEQIGWHHRCTYPFDESIKEYNEYSTTPSVKGLKPSANYRVTVVAVTVKEGPAASIVCYTDLDVPTSPPRDFTSSVYPKNIRLSWKEPFCNTSNGDVTGYLVYLEGLSPWVRKSERRSVTEKSVSFDVVPFSKYKAAVYAVRGAGRGRTSAEMDLETVAAEAPAPTDLKIYEKTSNSLSLAWRAPYPPHGEIVQYRISYAAEYTLPPFPRYHAGYMDPFYIYDRRSSGRNSYRKEWESENHKTVSVSQAQCSVPPLKDFHCNTIYSLTSNKKYKIKVSAINKGRSAGVATEITEEAVDTAPGPPSFLKVSRNSDTSINATWGEPYFKNGQIRKYMVTLTRVRTSSSLAETSRQPIEIAKETEEKEWFFSNLFPASTYGVRVSALNKVGYGQGKYELIHTPTKVPVVNKGLKFVGATETTITVTVYRQEPVGGPIGAYFVVVKELSEGKRSKRSTLNLLIPGPGCTVKTVESQYVAGKLLHVPAAGKNFTIGDGICTDGYRNKKLSIDMSYKIGLIIMSEYHSDRKYSQIRYIPDPIKPMKVSDDATPYGVLIGVLMFLTIFVCILIFFYVGRGDKALTELEKQALARAKRRAKEGAPPPRPGAITSALAYANSLYGDEFLEAESVMEEISYIVSVKELESFTLKSIKNNELKRQYTAIPKEQYFRAHSGRLSANRLKNRYGNLMPYDHSRVVLPLLHNDLNSDYINANYITGYKKLKTYIATQGPLPKTINDFWRMVWNEKVCKIVMVTNLVEGGRVKCEQYWPDSEGSYGRLTVSLMISEKYSDYIIRTFDVDSGRSSRQVKQFHYTTWPDHSVPAYTTTVVNFLEEVRSYHPENKSPVVVHCSAGVGRTGTIILLDSMLDMAKNAEEVDVCGHLCQMRRQRNNVVENLEQYIFVYKALVQALCWGKTSYASSDIAANLSKLRTSASRKTPSALEKQYQCLSKICAEVDNAATRSGTQPENVARNRVTKILPPERGRPILRPRPNGGSTYINAVYVNGYNQKDEFVATQYPLPCTITDFWELIWETKSKTIVLLQEISFKNSKSPQYWPAEGETVLYDELKIECTSMEVQGDVRVWSLTVSNLNAEGEPAVHLKILHHLSWAVDAPLPHNPESILRLVDMVEKLQQEDEKHHIVTVQCLNGSTACGIFCAAKFVCAKMNSEHEVDVFLAVQTIRTNRPHFIESFAQYNFLYDVAVKFLDGFGGYANFL